MQWSILVAPGNALDMCLKATTKVLHSGKLCHALTTYAERGQAIIRYNCPDLGAGTGLYNKSPGCQRFVQDLLPECFNKLLGTSHIRTWPTVIRVQLHSLDLPLLGSPGVGLGFVSATSRDVCPGYRTYRVYLALIVPTYVATNPSSVVDKLQMQIRDLAMQVIDIALLFLGHSELDPSEVRFHLLCSCLKKLFARSFLFPIVRVDRNANVPTQ